MKIIIGAFILWTGLVAFADYNRQEPTQMEIAGMCEKVDLGDGTFLCN